jgi:hypothetical protein
VAATGLNLRISKRIAPGDGGGGRANRLGCRPAAQARPCKRTSANLPGVAPAPPRRVPPQAVPDCRPRLGPIPRSQTRRRSCWRRPCMIRRHRLRRLRRLCRLSASQYSAAAAAAVNARGASSVPVSLPRSTAGGACLSRRRRHAAPAEHQLPGSGPRRLDAMRQWPQLQSGYTVHMTLLRPLRGASVPSGASASGRVARPGRATETRVCRSADCVR